MKASKFCEAQIGLILKQTGGLALVTEDDVVPRRGDNQYCHSIDLPKLLAPVVNTFNFDLAVLTRSPFL